MKRVIRVFPRKTKASPTDSLSRFDVPGMFDEADFALDTPDDEEPLRNASKLLKCAGFTRNQMRCYVLIGYPRDTFDQAESRLRLCVDLGFYPCAMLWRNTEGTVAREWRAFQRLWARPAIIAARLRSECAAEDSGAPAVQTGNK